jgi:hypothetical protein
MRRARQNGGKCSAKSGGHPAQSAAASSRRRFSRGRLDKEDREDRLALRLAKLAARTAGWGESRAIEQALGAERWNGGVRSKHR